MIARSSRRVPTLALLVIVAAAALARNAAAASPDEGLIVALGDSLTAGLGVAERDAWPAQLERRLRGAGYRWKVVNAGISGETSGGALARLDRVLRVNPDIVVVATGANDGLRGHPVEALRGNLDAVLATLAGRGVTAVLTGMQLPWIRGREYPTAFARVYPELALKHRAVFVPFLLEGVAGNPALNQEDGLHPNAAGYRVVTDLVYPGVLEGIGRVRASRAGTTPR
jgi:acyl-CoA thioesterase-1